MTIKTYRDLIVWQRAIELVVAVYQLSDRFPGAERFGLTAQARRSAVSVAANIAEGHERHSRGDYRRHISMASGSVAELETHLEISQRLGYASETILEIPRRLAIEVGRMLSALLRRLAK